MTPKLHAFVQKLGAIPREELLKDFAPNCCIATVRSLQDVFRHFRFPSAKAMCVELRIENKIYVDLETRGQMPRPMRPAALNRWFAETGAYSIGITPASALLGADSYGGHLVLQVQDAIIDASIAQCSRPKEGINMPDLLVLTPPAPWFASRDWFAREVNDCRVLFRILNDHSYRSASDWKNPAITRAATNRIIARLKNG